MICKIPLGKKKLHFAVIDKHNLQLVANRTWSLHEVKLKSGQVKRYARTWNKGKPLYMHRLLKEFPPYKIIDHKNGNGLDNTDQNLRVTSYAVNNRYRLGVKGYYRAGWRWRAMIKENGKSKCLGSFLTAESAMKAYNETAKLLFESVNHEN